MFLSLDVLRARKGDCLILHYGSEADPGLILIDGGPTRVYQPHLRPRLDQIRKARNLGSDQSLPVDLLMISHIDDDHINGIISLTNDLVVAKDAHQPLPVKFRNFWHNTFDDIVGNRPDELLSAVKKKFGAASLTGEPDTEGLDTDTAKVLASVGQGITLRDNIVTQLKARLNPQFGGGLVMTREKPIDMGKGLTLTVVGPMKDELEALQKKHDAFLKDKDETADVPASFTDESAANLSSIVVLAEAGGKRILLTGDARGDKMLEGLKQVGLLGQDDESRMNVDIFKIPHHGSDRNIEPVIFRRITARHYVFSGNGEHGNPERETLQMLLDERGDADYEVHLTYPVDEIDPAREEAWKKEQEREKTKRAKDLATKGESKVEVRPDWSSGEHSLAAFFAAHNEFAAKVRIVQQGQPHLIDLLDKVGF